MADGFAADVQEIQKYAQHWNEQAQQVGKLPAQIGAIETRLGSVLENTFATDALSFVVGGMQLNDWFDLRSKLQDAAAKLETMTKQLAAASESLRVCSAAYQIADQAAAYGFFQVPVFTGSLSADTSIAKLRQTLSYNENGEALNDAEDLVADFPDYVSKKITDTGPEFVPWAQGELTDPQPVSPPPKPVVDPTVLG